jgi:hypothetical protein
MVGQGNNVVVLGIPRVNATRPSIDYVLAIAPYSTLLAPPPVAVAHCLSCAFGVKRHAKDFALLTKRRCQGAPAGLLNQAFRDFLTGTVLSPSVVKVALTRAVLACVSVRETLADPPPERKTAPEALLVMDRSAGLTALHRTEPPTSCVGFAHLKALAALLASNDESLPRHSVRANGRAALLMLAFAPKPYPAVFASVKVPPFSFRLRGSSLGCPTLAIQLAATFPAPF